MSTGLTVLSQIEEIARALSEAFANGDLKKSMLGMPALSKVTTLKFFGKLEVQKEDAFLAIPAQLFGKCQLGGLHLSGFQNAQRDAFSAAIAAASGAMKDQVFIKNVFTVSGRSRLLRRQLLVDNGVVVEFGITVDRSSETDEKNSANQEEQEFYHVVAAAGTGMFFAAPLVTLAVVASVYSKCCSAKTRIGIVKDDDHFDMQNTKEISKESKIEMGIKSQEQCIHVGQHHVKKSALVYVV